MSDAPNGETYLITVKHEPQGVESGWMHEEVKPGTVLTVAPPAGEFFLAAHPERTAVLSWGGVGLPPMVSMMETILERHRHVPVHYTHVKLDGSTHAMGPHIRSLVKQHAHVKAP